MIYHALMLVIFVVHTMDIVSEVMKCVMDINIAWMVQMKE